MQFGLYPIPESNIAGVVNLSEYMQVNCLGYYEFEKTSYTRYRDHGRTDYLLIYHIEGTAQARSKGIDYDLASGTAVLYRPGEEQRYSLSDETPVKSLWIHFTGYGIESLLEKLQLADRNIFFAAPSDDLLPLFHMARNEIAAQRSGYEVYIASLLLQILTVISRNYLQSRFTSRQLETQTNFDLAITYIHSNYDKPITIPEIAHIAGLSISRYIQVFKQQIGTTPKDYIVKYRLNKAKELLFETNLTIRQISVIVGFSDQLYFSRMYRKVEGICPKEDRKRRGMFKGVT
ncbi:helix-turn-helix domain-containing protein [Paenibacillus sp. IITD108]|uniref:helix-turn-helix domain-containing protein n=1 Tax=Paenibacillus sp. IITD108 TaxID=3116649 RepID=UPI002F3E22C6